MIAFFRLLCPALLALAACSQERRSADADALTTDFDTVAGVPRVVNAGAAPAWRLTLLSSVGPETVGAETGGPEEFGQATTATLGPDGDEVYVADAQSLEIRVFGLDGRHRRTFGRLGEGPGEFPGYINSLAFAEDRLLALDLIGGRLNVYSPAGAAIDQRAARGRWGGRGPGEGLYPVGEGSVYSLSLITEPDGLSQVFVGQNVDGETGDTIRLLRDANEGDVTCEYNDGWLWHFENPYALRLVQHPGAGGTLYLATTDAYLIALTRGGDTLRVIERELPPEEVSDEEWSALTDEFQTGRSELPSSAVCEPNEPARPAFKPMLGGIHVDPEGKLWVETFQSTGKGWDVFDADGRLLGSVPWVEHKESSVPAFGADHVVVIRQDSLDVDHVDVWRIDREDSGN